MSDPAGTFNDGGIKLIEQTVVLKNAANTNVTYILKKCSLKGSSKRIVSTDVNDNEQGQRFSRQIPTGSGTLQYLVATDAPPTWPQAFTATTSTGATQNLILHGVGDEFGTGQEVMCPIEIAVYMNPTSPAVAGGV